MLGGERFNREEDSQGDSNRVTGGLGQDCSVMDAEMLVDVGDT